MSAAAILDGQPEAETRDALTRCCGASRWVEGMLRRRPFGDDATMMAAADAVWATMEEADVLEAFSHHPEIGADVEALRAKFGSTSAWAEGEQSGAAGASEDTLLALRDGNVAYRERHGFIFIVCATGKSADEMLGLLRARLNNERAAELAIAAGEQAKITRLRLEKLGSC